ncbi:MAG TPA: hypothetical protein VMW54_11895 [Terriglobia bacterium]|nr:hypothetical protein [Terriglobia bacterium]
MSEQLPLNFDCPDEPEAKPNPDSERPSGKPNEFFNGRIWVSDDDLPF